VLDIFNPGHKRAPNDRGNHQDFEMATRYAWRVASHAVRRVVKVDRPALNSPLPKSRTQTGSYSLPVTLLATLLTAPFTVPFGLVRLAFALEPVVAGQIT